MARFPEVSTAGARVPASIFLRLREHLARFPGGDYIPLQIGDTHLAPPASLHELVWTELPPAELYAYGSPNGWAPLVEAIVGKMRRKNKLAVGIGNVQITCGATHALACAVQALCDPGDELLLVTPHWPLIKGMALATNVVPIEIAYGPELGARLAAAVSPRTAAIYYATPNNPDGTMLGVGELAEIAAVAERHGLWILADEVYEDYAYDALHVSIAALAPDAAARTVTVFSFAKSYAQAGLRVGYAIAPEPIAATLKKLVNHSLYNVPVANQRAGLAALERGEPFLADARARYQAARDRALVGLHAQAVCPPGGAYLWVDFRDRYGDDCMPVLERIAEAGVLLTPGSAFGDACGGFARLCFTGVPPERLDEGLDRINAVLDA